MSRGKENYGDAASSNGGVRGKESGSRRRGRPPRRVGVSVSYRPATPEEQHIQQDALRLLLRGMVRRRMGTSKEDET